MKCFYGVEVGTDGRGRRVLVMMLAQFCVYVSSHDESLPPAGTMVVPKVFGCIGNGERLPRRDVFLEIC